MRLAGCGQRVAGAVAAVHHGLFLDHVRCQAPPSSRLLHANHQVFIGRASHTIHGPTDRGSFVCMSLPRFVPKTRIVTEPKKVAQLNAEVAKRKQNEDAESVIAIARVLIA